MNSNFLQYMYVAQVLISVFVTLFFFSYAGIPRASEIVITGICETIYWTIPCFPVMSIDFVRVETDQGPCLCKASCVGQFTDSLPKTIICTSQCNIDINNVNFKVIWEWNTTDFTDSDSISDYEIDFDDTDDGLDNVNLNESEDEESDEVVHTLPFEVLGVAHTMKNQAHMEACYVRMYDHKLPVLVRIQEEPENEQDRDAIAVHVNYNTGWHRVGYIQHELTKYVKDAISNGKLLSTEIEHIKFCVHWYRVGFYMKLLITKRGTWDNCVLLKSLRVR